MKKNLFFGLLSTAALAGLVSSCAGDDFSISSSTGGIAPIVGLDADVESAAPKGRAAAAISVDDLALSLTSADGSVSEEWASVNDFDKNKSFRVGTYTMAAYYGSLENEGFDAPYYYGESTFEVEENKTTPVSITAQLANSMVKIEYTEAFVDYFSSYAVKLHSEGGSYIDYSADETRAAYVRPGKVKIIADVVKQNGVSASLEAASFTAKPRYCYTVTVDVNNGGAGSAELVITFDDNVAEEDVTIDLSDEVLNAPAPQVTYTGFDPAQTYTLVSGMDASISPKLNIIARGGISAVTMTTESKTLEEQGWMNEIDLCGASASQQATLQGLGLSVRGLFGNVDQMAVIDLSNVMSNLKYRQNGSNTTKITFVVKDKIGKVTEPITLNIEVEPIEVAISEPADLFPGDEEVSFKLEYNGTDPEDNVDVFVMNQRGTFDPAEVISMTPISRAASDYLVTIKVAAEINPVKVKTVCKGVESDVITIKRVDPEYTITVNENDVFSTYAIFDVFDKAGNAVEIPASATIEISENGGAFSTIAHSATSKSAKVAGLKSSTNYSARIRFDEVPSPAVKFTTENASQIPFSGFDEWFNSTTGNNWVRSYVGANNTESVWGTNNYMTTNAGSNYAYVRISGTIQDTNGHNGSAALIRTVGWGSGNSATGSKGTSGNCKYTDPGLLHIGATRTARPAGYSADDNKTNGTSTGPLTTDDLQTGMEFSSRPSSMSFWYKYSPKNGSDKGVAEIYVKDAAGNVISSKTINLDAATSFTEITLPLEYASKAPKCGTIYVKFLSSCSKEFVDRTNDNFSGPGFANLSDGTFMGSQLWIDEVKLNY